MVQRTAVNAAEVESALSTAVSAITKTAGPSWLQASVISKSEIDLSWDDVTGAKSYNIYRLTSENDKYSKVGTSKTGSYKNTGLKAGTGYWYKVTAVTSSGEGDYSETITATTLNN
ncbi:MAG: fibronectin type III domain-containing protein [Desulfitobacteriaceae bacterium]